MHYLHIQCRYDVGIMALHLLAATICTCQICHYMVTQNMHSQLQYNITYVKLRQLHSYSTNGDK